MGYRVYVRVYISAIIAFIYLYCGLTLTPANATNSITRSPFVETIPLSAFLQLASQRLPAATLLHCLVVIYLHIG